MARAMPCPRRHRRRERHLGSRLRRSDHSPTRRREPPIRLNCRHASHRRACRRRARGRQGAWHQRHPCRPAPRRRQPHRVPRRPILSRSPAGGRTTRRSVFASWSAARRLVRQPAQRPTSRPRPKNRRTRSRARWRPARGLTNRSRRRSTTRRADRPPICWRVSWLARRRGARRVGAAFVRLGGRRLVGRARERARIARCGGFTGRGNRRDGKRGTARARIRRTDNRGAGGTPLAPAIVSLRDERTDRRRSRDLGGATRADRRGDAAGDGPVAGYRAASGLRVDAER